VAPEQPLPSGTLTFLFTDIEGSTRLVQTLGDGWGEVLSTHHRIMREAFEQHGGREVGTRGDGFFAVFTRARDAIGAAVAGQRALAKERWAGGAEVKVRMGLHSGEAGIASDDYIGLGIHRAARISALAHGEQVLISTATRELIKDDLPAGVRLRDSGEVRLKDLEGTEHVHQLVIDGLRSDFPPLKTRRRPLYRRPVPVAAALVALAAVVAAIAVLSGGSGGGVSVSANSIAAIDPHSGHVVAAIPVGVGPTEMTSGSGALWVINQDDQTVSRVDPRQGRIVRSLPIKEIPTDIVAAGGGIWVVGSEPGAPRVAVRRIDPEFDSVGDPTQVGNVVPSNPGTVAAFGDHLWVAPSDGLLTRLDTQSARVLQSIDPKNSPYAVAVGPDALWVAGGDSDTVTRVDPTGLLTPIPVGHDPVAVAVGAGAVWAADRDDGAVIRIDPQTNAVTNTIPVGPTPEDLAVGAGSVWVSHGDAGTVTRIDASSERVVETIHTGGSARGLTVAGGRVWVAVGESAPPASAPAASGTLRLASDFDPRPLDPALAYNSVDWQLEAATCVRLLHYPDRAGPAGSQLQPEAATSLPAVSDGGRTYTFTVRKGFRFSPPSNQPVTAETFKYTIERALAPKMHGPAGNFLPDVVGSTAYASGRARHIAGVIASGDKLIIRLQAPAPDLPVRLSTPFFCAVPIGTPVDPKGVDVIPMAGPYYLASSDPSVVLVRNPNYSGGRPRGPKRIELTVGVAAKQSVRLVEQGKSDYVISGVDAAEFRDIRARYGSSAARRGAPHLFANPLLAVSYVLMNPTRGPFADVRLRRAVNFALDRRALAKLGVANVQAGEGKPTDQYLPPGMPGFHDVRIYPSSPDLVAARKLAGRRRRRAVLYSCTEPPCAQQAQVLKNSLAQIGVDVEVRTFSLNRLTARLGRPHEPFDLAIITWFADYPDPDDFLDTLLLKGASLEPPFRDPRYVPRLEAAAKLAGPRRYLAYGRLDAEIARDAAPWAAYANGISYDFFSARVGCQIYQPVYGMDLAALCLR
jgi:YVTN family beta-propeller protein